MRMAYSAVRTCLRDYSLAFAHLETTRDIANPVPLDFLGTKSVVKHDWDLLKCSEIAALLSGHERHADDSINLVEMANLRTLVEQTAQEATEREIYLECVDQLRAVLISVRRLSGRQSSALSSSWVATIPDGFRDLLSQRQPLALLIIAHFATLFTMCPEVWWYRSWDSWILNAVQSELPAEYLPWLEWPLSQLRSTSSMASTPSAMAT